LVAARQLSILRRSIIDGLQQSNAERDNRLDSRAKCNRALREPDLHVFAKLFEDCLKRSLEAQVKAEGLAAFHKRVLFSPFLADRIGELKSFDDIKLLSVTVDRLRRWWRPGMICIGDAAHAMSPIGGVGINIAIQDAVAAANRLAGPLEASKVSNDDLRAIEDRRRFPARMTQAIQLTMQNQIIRRALAGTKRPKPPLLFKLFDRIPALQRIPGRLLAVDLRQEHVQTPDVLGPCS
jgi:2-polyprenyl-6-methoxyphenol hydroxylase-like FAD-dependent oxidoreductase